MYFTIYYNTVVPPRLRFPHWSPHFSFRDLRVCISKACTFLYFAMHRCCVIHYGIIRLLCRKVLLATPRISKAQSHSSRAPDGVYSALWFSGTNNHPPLLKYKVSLKYHAKEIYHPLFRPSFLIFCFLLSTRTRAKTEIEGRKNGRPRAYQKVFPLSLASANSFWRNKLVRRHHLNLVRFYFVLEQGWNWEGICYSSQGGNKEYYTILIR